MQEAGAPAGNKFAVDFAPVLRSPASRPGAESFSCPADCGFEWDCWVSESPRILFAAAEVAPLAKAGGLADVAGSLPKALRQLGTDVRVVMPFYGQIDTNRFPVEPVVEHLAIRLDGRYEPARVFQTTLPHDLPVYLIDMPQYFHRETIYGDRDDGERFIAFSRAALEFTRAIGWRPEVIHSNDWHTGIVPNWLQTIYREDPHFAGVASVFSIHNLAYQGIFSPALLDLADLSHFGLLYPETRILPSLIDLMARGIIYTDVVSTVSEQYAREIVTPEFGERLDSILLDRQQVLVGILNGIDYEQFDPASDPNLATPFDAETLDRRGLNKLALQAETGLDQNLDIPLIGMITRLVDQKGFDILTEAIRPLLERVDVQIVLLGTGEERYISLFRDLHDRFPGRAAAFFRFDESLAQRIYGGSDLFLMPSRYEPCGIGQLIAMRYGSVPVVRAVGGLADTVTNYDPRTGTGNGFSFGPNDAWSLFATVVRAVETFRYPEIWQSIQRRGMAADFSWNRSALKYLDLYRRALAIRRGVWSDRAE